MPRLCLRSGLVEFLVCFRFVFFKFYLQLNECSLFYSKLIIKLLPSFLRGLLDVIYGLC
jgi:hypothetical protein